MMSFKVGCLSLNYVLCSLLKYPLYIKYMESAILNIFPIVRLSYVHMVCVSASGISCIITGENLKKCILGKP